MSNITLVIPAKKEKESLPKVLDELKEYNYQILIVLEENDKETIESIKNYNYKTIYQTNKGYGDALRFGIKNVDTEFFCIFNADGSFDPKEIRAMIEHLITKKIDLVFGSRYQENGTSDDDTIITLIGNFIFTKIGNIFFNLSISDILYTFVIGKTNQVNKLDLRCKDFRFCVELPIKAKKNNLKIISVPCYERSRIAGQKKVNAFKDGFLILKELIKLFFS